MFFQWQTTNRDEQRIFTNEMSEGDKKLDEIKSKKKHIEDSIEQIR